MAYGRGTDVSVAKTKMQIEELLWKHGATAIMTMSSHTLAQVVFQLGGCNIRLAVPLPNPHDKTLALDRYRRKRSEADRLKRWEQACRERWRVVWLLVKAKLEAIELGHSTVAREFLHDMLVGDPSHNVTFGEKLARGELDAILGNGAPLLPPPKGGA